MAEWEAWVVDTDGTVELRREIVITDRLMSSEGIVGTFTVPGPIIGTFGGIPVVSNASLDVIRQGEPWLVLKEDDEAIQEVPAYSAPGTSDFLPVNNPCDCQICRFSKGGFMDREQVVRVAAFIGSELMPDNAQWTNRFTISSSSSSSTYTVAQRRTDGVWGCSCPGWKFNRHCKHLADILGRLAKLQEEMLSDPQADPQVVAMLRSARTAFLDLDSIPVANLAKPRHYTRQIDL